MKRALQIALGILTAIGGFVDIGDFVTNGLVGARFGMSLAWSSSWASSGSRLYAEMSGRIAALPHRPVFDIVRERLGPRFALVNLFASYFINFLTLTAELAGVAVAIQLATSVNYLLWIPIVGFLVWAVVWRMPFNVMENLFGLLGLCLLVFVVALWKLGPDWSGLLSQATHPRVPTGEGHPTWIYYGIALFGAAMTPYEVFLFSSGAVEVRWTRKDSRHQPVERLHRLPARRAAVPGDHGVRRCRPAAEPRRGGSRRGGRPAGRGCGGKAGDRGAARRVLRRVVRRRTGDVAVRWLHDRAVFRLDVAEDVPAPASGALPHSGAADVARRDGARVDDHRPSGRDRVLGRALRGGAAADYFPILVVANDRRYLGDKTNSAFSNTLASIYLLIILAAAVVTIPLMLGTKAGL